MLGKSNRRHFYYMDCCFFSVFILHQKMEGKGKFIFYPNSPTGEIWDCTDCDYPNREEVVRKFLWKLFKGQLTDGKV